MAATTEAFISPSSEGHLRPFDLKRDLGRVADLVEQCFSDTLDPDGQRYLQQMRAAARNPGFMNWAAAATDMVNVPLTGYVWEEDGMLVGNLSLIPFGYQGRRYYLIANVAVHPNFRRRGIARSLTAHAMEHARVRGAPSAWLQVREGNLPAVKLYENLGFVERARRSTWFSRPEAPPSPAPPGIIVGRRQTQDWRKQEEWLKRSYPPELSWHLPVSHTSLRPGITGGIYRLFTNSFVRQWAARGAGNRLLGVLAWHSTSTHADALTLAIPAGSGIEAEAVLALLSHARRRLSPRRSLSLDYPAREADQAIHAAGFYLHQTLIWMEAGLAKDE